MEELDLKELFSIFWHKKAQIILIILIFIVLGIIYTIGFTTPMYSSETTLLLAGAEKGEGQEGSTNSITTTEISINSNLISTYRELVRSDNVLGEVISNLGIDISIPNLRNNVSVTAVQDTDVIKITVTTTNAEYSASIANETAKVFTEKIAEFYNMNNVHVVDEAKVSTAPSNINHQRDVLIFAFIGIVVAIIYVLIANMLDTTIKTAEEIEKYFKVPVLASIPVCDLDGALDKRRGGKR